MGCFFFCKILPQCECFHGSMHWLMFICLLLCFCQGTRFDTIRTITENRLHRKKTSCCMPLFGWLCCSSLQTLNGFRHSDCNVKGLISLSIPFLCNSVPINRIPGMPCSQPKKQQWKCVFGTICSLPEIELFQNRLHTSPAVIRMVHPVGNII